MVMESRPDGFSKYRIWTKIYSGMISHLYKAYDPDRDEVVALKILKEEFSFQPEVVERFQREAKIAKDLEHPNIIKIYDIGREGDYYYFTMKYVNGPSLRKLLEEEQILPVEKALRIIKECCLGLHFAHCAKVVHRDIKPSNIMIDEDGSIVILDFGIAKVLYLARITRPGYLLGTPEYMSPEQVKGILVDGRTDIYSLGIVLYELLTGTVPFKGKDFWEVAEKIVKEPPPKPSEFNSELTKEIDELILKAIDKDRAKRFLTGLEMANALNQVLGLPLEEVEETKSPVLVGEERRKEKIPKRGIETPLKKPSGTSKATGQNKGLWLPPVIALSILLYGFLCYKFHFLILLFPIMIGVVMILWVLNVIKKGKPAKRYSNAQLLLTHGTEIVQEFILNARSVVIGRDQPNGIELFKETISRAHAQITNENGIYVIYDLNSTNGTFVNDRRIQRCILKDGDRINLGGETLIFRGIK